MRKIGESNLSRIRFEKCKTRKDFNLRVLVLLFRRRKLLTAVTNVTSVTNATKPGGRDAESTLLLRSSQQPAAHSQQPTADSREDVGSV